MGLNCVEGPLCAITSSNIRYRRSSCIFLTPTTSRMTKMSWTKMTKIKKIKKGTQKKKQTIRMTQRPEKPKQRRSGSANFTSRQDQTGKAGVTLERWLIKIKWSWKSYSKLRRRSRSEKKNSSCLTRWSTRKLKRPPLRSRQTNLNWWMKMLDGN